MNSTGLIDDAFAFTQEDETLIKRILLRYPPQHQASAVMPLLDLAQRRNRGWLSEAAIEHVAKRLSMAPLRVREVASFYSMFNLAPVGRYLIQVCSNNPLLASGQ